MSKLTVDECKRIILQGKRQLTEAENHIAELEANNSTRWYELFGTPEKAVQTLAAIGGQYPCDEGKQDCVACPLSKAPCRLNRSKPEESKMLEWLRGDAE